MNKNELKDVCNVLGTTIESSFGFEKFAKVWWNSLVKLLVENGLITEIELLESFRREANIFLIN